ncbi:hypothetical protein LX64_03790 [Chitinophaga skermanii]|uniref:Uncharacterized protein n=1 Tax=Chitinophaga skermanii TaxID=331697 RepID=A0A327QCK0_9BACT|nr:hypothetical protein [Chitinophaga skermanii]RAJ01574.1 hypothetical protein LX64_03790 [Chitinophaga skermanii]
MKKFFLSFATVLLIAGAAVSAQDKNATKDKSKKEACKKEAGCCEKKESTAKATTKSCCKQPTKAAAIKAAKPADKKA